MAELAQLLELCKKQAENSAAEAERHATQTAQMQERDAALTVQNTKLAEQVASMLQRLDADAVARAADNAHAVAAAAGGGGVVPPPGDPALILNAAA